jgi:CHASE2 domain-containing sensor protein
MPNIFLSYRRDDTFSTARLVRDRLSARFGKKRVFMDVRNITSGEEWKPRLAAEIQRATHVIVLIGPQWLHVADASGRRLDNPQDVVRWEVSQSLRLGKIVVPVLVDRANPFTASDLPEDLRTLSEKSFFTLSQSGFEQDVKVLSDEISPGVPPDVRLRLVKAAAVVSLLVSAVALVLARLNPLAIDEQVAALGDAAFETHIDPDLLLVALQPHRKEEEHDKLRLKRRAQYAHLIDILSAVGARSIVFDLMPSEDSIEFDAPLAKSIRAAQASGSTVVFGFKAIADSQPVAAAELVGAGAALGLVCAGREEHDDTLATVALVRGNQKYSSLPLLARYGRLQELAVFGAGREVQFRDSDGRFVSLPFSLLQRYKETDRQCPALSDGSEVARLIIPVSHRERWHDASRRFKFDDVLEHRVDAAAFAHKTVVIGAEHRHDRVRTRLDRADARFGFEFQADAINALMNGDIVQPLGLLGQAGLILAMAGLASAWRVWHLDHRWRFNKAALACVVVLYLALAVLAYIKFRILINPVYQVATLLTVWGILAQLERRWLDDVP